MPTTFPLTLAKLGRIAKNLNPSLKDDILFARSVREAARSRFPVRTARGGFHSAWNNALRSDDCRNLLEPGHLSVHDRLLPIWKADPLP